MDWTFVRRALGMRLLIGLCLVGCSDLAYQHMNDPSRDTWQKPLEVIAALAITPGSRVADVGAGGGYFTWYLANAVGPQGKVFAVEIDETALDIITKEIQSRGIMNVKTVRADPNDAKLPEPVDLAFICDTYHHMTNRVAYFQKLALSLTTNGRVAILDFHPHGFFSGFLGHGTAKEDVRREMEAAGYRHEGDFKVVDSQHFQVFARKQS